MSLASCALASIATPARPATIRNDGSEVIGTRPKSTRVNPGADVTVGAFHNALAYRAALTALTALTAFAAFTAFTALIDILGRLSGTTRIRTSGEAPRAHDDR